VVLPGAASPGWSRDRVLAAAAAALAAGAAEVECEQAVRGLDAASELELCARLADGFAEAGFGVAREARYPGDRDRPRRSEGRRCDLVLTADRLPLDEDGRQLGLFAPRTRSAVEDALWLEVKTCAQFVEGGGGNRGYATQLGAPLFRDVRKLASDPRIHHAALLLVLFTAARDVATHDLDAWLALASARALPVGEPRVAHLPIGDRFGNALCTAALFPVAG
jgi:hypothetical protein